MLVWALEERRGQSRPMGISYHRSTGGEGRASDCRRSRASLFYCQCSLVHPHLSGKKDWLACGSCRLGSDDNSQGHVYWL